MSRRALLVAVVVLAAILAGSCGNKPQDGAPEPYSERAGPDGGTIEDPAGTTLDIPAGALEEKTSISVSTFDQASDFAAEFGFPAPTGVLCGVQLEPDGLEFNEPVTLSLPTPSYLGVGEYSLCFWNEDDEVWEFASVATVTVSGSAEAQITHFCWYAIFEVPPEALAEFGRIAEDPDYAGYTLQQLVGVYKGYLEEELPLLSGAMLYQGCCYDGMAYKVRVDYYPPDGEAGSYEGGLGEPTEISYTMSYSDGATYTVVLTDYLACSAEGDIGVLASETALEKGESTDLKLWVECGSTAVAGREIALSLSGPGKLSATSVLTNEAGEATASYTAEEDGTAVITVKVEGCGCDAQGDRLWRDEVTITVGDQPPAWHGSFVMDIHYIDDPTESNERPATCGVKELTDHYVMDFHVAKPPTGDDYVWTLPCTITETHDIEATGYSGDVYYVDDSSAHTKWTYDSTCDITGKTCSRTVDVDYDPETKRIGGMCLDIDTYSLDDPFYQLFTYSIANEALWEVDFYDDRMNDYDLTYRCYYDSSYDFMHDDPDDETHYEKSSPVLMAICHVVNGILTGYDLDSGSDCIDAMVLEATSLSGEGDTSGFWLIPGSTAECTFTFTFTLAAEGE